MTWQTFNLAVSAQVARLTFNRPDALNAMVPALWRELPQAVQQLDDSGDVRALIIASTGKHFTAGMDLSVFNALVPDLQAGLGRSRAQLMQLVGQLQESFSVLERARFPVIAAIQGGCIGGGVDLVTACDLRFASRDAFFSVHEINLAMTADVGTFPRLQKLIPEGIARELAYTGDRLSAERAAGFGLVNAVMDDHDVLLKHCEAIARKIAEKSPLAVWGSKRMLNFGRDHSTQDTLDHVAAWQSGMLDLDDVQRAVAAQQDKREGEFADLGRRQTLED
jgi:enoyl-CoA hydratase